MFPAAKNTCRPREVCFSAISGAPQDSKAFHWLIPCLSGSLSALSLDVFSLRRPCFPTFPVMNSPFSRGQLVTGIYNVQGSLVEK